MNAILVTGAAGFIGSVVTEKLLQDGYKVIGIDNFQESSPSSVNTEIIFYEGNYGDKDLLNEIFGKHKIDCVFHFAAETTIQFSMINPSVYFKNNVVNGLNLLDSMLNIGLKKIIFSSTAAVYGEPDYVPIDEDHQKSPVNSYGSSKLMFENILDWYNYAYGLKFNLFRYFNACGATGKSGENRINESHLLPLIFKSVFDDKFILKVYGNDYDTQDGTCVRDYVHVKDIAQAHILGINNMEIISNGKYNLGSAVGYTNLEVINMVEKVTNKKVKWEFDKRRIGDPARLVASNERARSELGWKIVDSELEQIIKDAYGWFEKKFL